MPIRRHRQHRDGLPDDLKYGHQKGKAAAIDTQPQQGADAADAVDEALRDLYIEIPDIDLKGIIEDDDEAAEKAPRGIELETRYIRQPLRNKLRAEQVKYENAGRLARDIGILHPGERVDALIAGSFIMGDFIMAYLVENKLRADYMLVSTLSLSERNILAFAKLFEHGYIGQLDMMLSTYFFANEYHGLVRYLYRELDKDNRFQLAVSDIHTKITMFHVPDVGKFVIHGSANLRSSQNVEQICIENNPELYDFYTDAFTKVIDVHKTIRKPIRGAAAWDIMTRVKFNA